MVECATAAISNTDCLEFLYVFGVFVPADCKFVLDFFPTLVYQVVVCCCCGGGGGLVGFPIYSFIHWLVGGGCWFFLPLLLCWLG